VDEFEERRACGPAFFIVMLSDADATMQASLPPPGMMPGTSRT
jgi:hypothetical protein